MAFASKSPWVIHYDASSCNGCDIEVLAALCPGYDAERFGVINTGNPKHADIFLVTGSVNERNIEVVKEIYNRRSSSPAASAPAPAASSTTATTSSAASTRPSPSTSTRPGAPCAPRPSSMPSCRPWASSTRRARR